MSRKEKVPSILYKYFSPERSAFFLNPMLRFSPFDELNDPFEGEPTFSDIPMNEDRRDTIRNEKIMKNMLKSGKYSEIIPDQDIANIMSSTMVDDNFESQAKRAKLYSENYRTFARQNPVGVLSLTKASNNILMWSHYAGQHKGFVVGLDTSHCFFKGAEDLNPLIGRLLEVKYSKRRHNKFDDYVRNTLKSGEIGDIFKELSHEDDYYVDRVVNRISDEVKTKSNLWKYEKEWRYIVGRVDSIDSLGVKGLVEIDPGMIKSVYLGMASSKFQDALAVKFKQKYKKVVLKKARMHETEYKLRFDAFG